MKANGLTFITKPRSIAPQMFRWKLSRIPPISIARPHSWQSLVMASTLVAYLLGCTAIYFAYVQPWIAGQIDVRIGADSDRYWDMARLRQDTATNSTSLISLTGNFLGPVSLALFLKNGFFVMCFNIAILLVALKVVSTISGVNIANFGFLVMVCVELIPNIATLNKEILTLLASVVAAKYLYSEKRSILLLAVALGISLFTRWELAVELVLALALSHGVFRGRPKTALIVLILLITVAYPLAFSILGIDMSMFDWLLNGANTIVKLDAIQMAYGFPLVILPKIAMMMCGLLLQPAFFFSGHLLTDIAQDPQEALFQPIGSICYVLLFGYAFLTKRIKLSNPVIFLCAVTLIASAATPFVQPRYLYGLYIILCIDVSREAAPKRYGLVDSLKYSRPYIAR